MQKTIQTQSEDKVAFLQGEMSLLLSERNTCPYCSNDTFARYLQKIVKAKKLNSQKFCSQTGLSPQIYTRIKDDDYRPSLPTIVAICVGLRVSFECSENLLKSAGLILTGSTEHTCYKVLLQNTTEITIDEANNFLTQQGFKAISDKYLYNSQKINSSARNKTSEKTTTLHTLRLKSA